MESVMNQDLCPLVACATTNELLVGCVEAAVKSIGNEFYVADQLAHVLNECQDHLSLCVVVDHKTVFEAAPGVSVRWSRRIPTLVSVPHGDVQAAFRAATTRCSGGY